MRRRRRLLMSRNGLTFTVIFLAESANYGEGVGNISTLKKMTRGNYEQYSYCLLYTSPSPRDCS
mgnify:CR=1 FL=1